MQRERKKGITFSGVMHAVLVLLVIVGLPTLFMKPPPPEPMVITVDVVPVGAISNIKPSETPPMPKPKPEEKQQETKKPTPAVKTADNTPPPPPKPDEKKPDEKKPDKKEEKKPDEKKEKKKEDDLLAVLRAVKEKAATKQADKPDKKKEQSSPNTTKANVPYDPNLPISQTVKDSIRQQLYKCWSPPAGAKNAHELVVVVELWLNRDATLIDVKPTAATKAKMGRDGFYRAAVESAMRAVRICSPLKELPADKYEGWSYMEFTFDPRDMLY